MESEYYEWDDAKAEANFRKHRVRFEHAVEACEDPDALIELDDSEDYGEDRFILNRTGVGRRARRRLHRTQPPHSRHFSA